MSELIQNNNSATGEDALIGFVTDGLMSRDSARMLSSLPLNDRLEITTSLSALVEQGVDEGQERRANWVTRMLQRDEITEGARTVFIQTAAARPEIGFKSGLGDRAYTHGRHSSPDTRSSGEDKF